jgi:trans-aconitate 2-methyltransferase
MSAYVFGDSDLAARRLAMVAEAFATPTAAFLERSGRPGAGLAIDLGCGTGHTTRLLAHLLRPRRTLGLERSAAFVERARAGARDGEVFAEHDVTAVPFPEGPADLLFCRLLLTHLENTAAVLARWATQLAPGGLLLLDEVDTIDAGHPATARYLAVMAALLDGRGQRLEIGPVLHGLADPPGLRRVDSRAVQWTPPPTLVGQMFVTNLRVWRDQPEVAGLTAPGELDDLAGALTRIAAGDEPAATTWHLRQMVFQRG